MPAHIKALKNCEQELAAVDYNAVKRLLVTFKLLKDENTYDSFDQLVAQMITRQCPEDFFVRFCEVLKMCPQYQKIAQMLIDDYTLQLPDQTNPDRYRSVLQSTTRCKLQEETEAIYNKAVEALQDSFSGVQLLCHAIIEMIKQAYQRPLEQRLNKCIMELQAIKNNLGPQSSKTEVNDAIRTLLTYLQIIVDIIDDALSSWFNAEEIAVCHAFMKYLADMVNQMDNEVSRSLPKLQKKFNEYCKKLENRIWYFKNGPFIGKLASIVGTLAMCVYAGCNIYLVPIVLVGVGGYCACESIDQYFNKKLESGNTLGKNLINEKAPT